MKIEAKITICSADEIPKYPANLVFLGGINDWDIGVYNSETRKWRSRNFNYRFPVLFFIPFQPPLLLDMTEVIQGSEIPIPLPAPSLQDIADAFDC